MAKKKTDYPTFSNGTEGMIWMGRNCDRCIKAEKPVIKYKVLVGYVNKGRCRVNKEILDSMLTGGVTKRVSRIIKGLNCPFLKTDWPKRNPAKKDGDPKLFEDGE